MLVGYSYTSGANFEIYPDDHTSRPGDFRGLIGSHTGSANFIVNHYDGGSNFSSIIKSTINGATLAGSTTINDNGRDIDFVIEGTSNPTLLIVDASTNRIGINVAPTAKLHLNQNSATGGSALHIEQDDVSEEFIRLTGQAAPATLSQSLVAAGAVSGFTPVGYAKINIQDEGNQIADGFYYVQFGVLS